MTEIVSTRDAQLSIAREKARGLVNMERQVQNWRWRGSRSEIAPYEGDSKQVLIITEELGELCEQILKGNDTSKIISEAVQVAACAQYLVEAHLFEPEPTLNYYNIINEFNNRIEAAKQKFSETDGRDEGPSVGDMIG
jgi:hypothetical protein